MCIIAAKPAGVKMPDSATITRMWYRNSDGAGIMYVKDGKVRIDKGFMKLADFEAHLKKVGQTVNLDETSVVMHFRITTHGGTCPENCHPFPITRSVKALQTLHQSAPIGIAHNGVIPITPRKGISDTMEYIATQLAPLYDMDRNFVKSKPALELVKNAIGSKMAFLTASNEIYLVGDFVEEAGIKYSNRTFEPYTYYNSYASLPYSGWSSADELDDAPWKNTAYEKGFYEDSYEEIPLMWAAYLSDGHYFKVDGSNDMIDDLDDLLLDEKGRTYAYDWNSNYATPAGSIRIYDANGKPAVYNPDEADLEPVSYTYADIASWKATPTQKARSKSKTKKAASKAASTAKKLH